MRTREEILAEIDAAQASDPSLSALSDVDSNTSAASWTKLLKNMWVLLVQIVEDYCDKHQLSVNNAIANARIGDLQWYVDQVKAFQIGDPISIIAGKVAYSFPDPSKQIIAQAAAVEDTTTGRLLIKAVKAGGVVLTTNELSALKAYVNAFKYAGVNVDVSSLAADELLLAATVQIDRKILAADGSLLTDSSVFPVRNAISAYCSALPFNSLLNNTALTDAIQKVPGVIDFDITASSSRRAGSLAWIAYERETSIVAGHLTLHADTAITYVN